MSRVPTDRVTVRLNRLHLNTIDALIATGQIRNRTQAISEAVRDWVNSKAVSAKQLLEASKNQIDLQALAAQISKQAELIAKLQKK